MSTIKLNNRVENLFANLNNQDIEDLPTVSVSLPQSWSWETDANGIYTACSDEVKDILSLSPSDFIGSPLLSCHILKEDRKALIEKLQNDEFPFEVILNVETKGNKLVLTRFHIFKVTQDNQKHSIFRGFSQVIEQIESKPANEIQPLHNNQLVENSPLSEEKTQRELEVTQPEETENSEISLQGKNTDASESKVIEENLDDKETDAKTQPLAPEQIEVPAEKDLAALEIELKKTSHSGRVIEPTPFRKKQPSTDFTKLSKTAPLGPLHYRFLGSTHELKVIQPKGIIGLAIEGDDFKPSENVWTQQAVISYSENVLVSSPASEDNPAILTSPLNLRNQKTGVIEVIDTSPSRKWSEEDRLLMQEISTQLGLALENAQLYSAVQKELGERVKAEELTSRRNRDLATLNQIGQRLSRLVTRDEIFPLVSSMIQQTMDIKNLLISLYEADKNTFSFPVCIVDGKPEKIPSRESHAGYQEAMLKSHAPLVLNDNAKAYLGDEIIDHPYKSPRSLLAIPLLVGERVIGVITALDYEKERAFDQVQVELLSTVATQVATSLENSNLFEGITTAFETIEGRERYQANVTRAVALLSESGAQSLPEILKFLSAAALCERVYYAEPVLEKNEGLVWKASEIYVKLDTNVLLRNELLSRLVATKFPSWISDLSSKGWHSITIDEAQGEEKQYLQSQKINSLLLLSIPRGENKNGFIALENFTSIHEWKKEEIDILRIASDAFTNTLIREELLKQVQSSLEETESLYSSSHQLALSNTMQEMVAAVIQGVHSQSINRGVLILFHYDAEGQIERMVVEANYYSGAGTPPPPVGTEYLQSLYKTVFVAQNPIFYDDVTDSQIDKNLQDILIRQNIHSMAVLPLWSGNRQGGALLLISIVKHRFSEQEIRSLPPLVDQMATTIENLRLFESTQDALAETELLYKISSGISSAANLDELVKLVGENALPQAADAIHLFIASTSQQGKPSAFDFVGTYTNQKQFKTSGERIAIDRFSLVDFSKPEPQTVADIQKTILTPDAINFFTKLGCSAISFIPMLSAGHPIGLLMASSAKPVEFNKEELQTLQIVTNSISVAIERQRLLSEAQQRAVELQAASEIARDTTSTLSLDVLLNRIVNLLRERFGFYHTAIYLMDSTETFAQIQEATGRAGIEMKQHQHRVAVGSKSVIGSSTATGNPSVINDTTHSSIYYPNPLLPDTRSELCLPLKIGDKVIGALDIHSNQPDAFSQAELTVFQILTDQISVAIDNARAYEMSQRAVAEMRELDRVKSQFLANMSHELRTPLNSVIGFSRVILKGIDGPINDIQQQDISSIYSSGMHLLTMINEILDMSKIEAGKMELQVEKVSIGDIINGALSTAAGLVKDKPIKLMQNVPSDLPAVNADEIRINQVIINLISNAVKFTEKGTITISAQLSKSPDAKPEIMVTVADTGIGIAAEDQSKLFQRFSQVDDSPTRKTGGTGLGLSICRSLIDLHGGRIGLLNSEVGKGSVFYFTLPLEEPKPELNLEQFSHEHNVILSIDDDLQVIALYERFLQSSGYNVIAETHPENAVQRAIELKPLAITLDIVMPNKDGWQVMRDLKQNKNTRNIPILICSILEEEEKGFSFGASEYLMKPFVQEDLINAIHRMDHDGNFHELLIIDDDAGDLRLTQKMIENGGNFHVTLAEGGKDALEVLNTLTPDVIILDLFMPGLNGFDLLEIFRSDPRLNRIPVIILTGADLNTEQQAQLAEFGKHIFAKGMLKEKDLLEYIEETLNKIKNSQNNGLSK